MSAKEKSRDSWMDLNPNITVPKTIRVPQHIAFQMDLYTEQLGTNIGRWLTTVMEDVLPAFKPGASPTVNLRLPVVLEAMRKAGVGPVVDTEELKRKITLGAPQGRPRKQGGKLI
jgi:hypothetical protein